MNIQTRVVLLGLGLGAGLGLFGCDQSFNLGGRCNAKTCGGCCDANGFCQPGSDINSCGTHGGMCFDCQGLQCVAGTCEAGGATGGGAGVTGGGTGGLGGGSASGGGIGRLDQEIVSGTRLKAVVDVGADGSKSPRLYDGVPLFWDSILEVYCARDANWEPSLCRPVLTNRPHGGDIGPYRDSSCRSMLALLSDVESIGLPASTKTKVTSSVSHDGGSGFYSGYQTYVGPVYEGVFNGGKWSCVLAGQSDGGQVDPTGEELPWSAFAAHSTVIE